jgi:hypothetical protein
MNDQHTDTPERSPPCLIRVSPSDAIHCQLAKSLKACRLKQTKGNLPDWRRPFVIGQRSDRDGGLRSETSAVFLPRLSASD